MDQLAGMPVTLLIKAPNQKVGDQTVECFLDWSVQKLKNHLTNVYPSKPTEKNQRIIYSGKLLKDNLLLKDVLRLDDQTLQQHTIHLVCSQTPEEVLRSFKPVPAPSKSSPSPPIQSNPSTTNLLSSSPANTVRETESDNVQGSSDTSSGEVPRRLSTPAEPTLPTTRGLRHRTLSTPSFSNYNYPYSYGNYPMQYGQQAPNQQPGYMMANQQQQAYWMQHIYAQQMAQYMQYSNQFAAGGVGAGINAANFPQAHAPIVAPQPHAPDQQQPAAIINPPVVAGPNPDQNVRMNAGLGPAAVDDDDNDNVQRDWLDWIYTFCRFGVLLSLVYFYSSLGRFLMVTGFMLFIFMYQKRWFRLRRAPVARDRLDENRNAELGDRGEDQNDQEQPPQQQEEEDGDETTERDGSAESQEDGETDSTTETTTTMTPAVPEPPKPGVLTIAWVFISTFFTSLFPQDPNAVAGN